MKNKEIELTKEEKALIRGGGYVKKTGYCGGIFGEWGFGLAPFSGEIMYEKLDNKPGEFCFGGW